MNPHGNVAADSANGQKPQPLIATSGDQTLQNAPTDSASSPAGPESWFQRQLNRISGSVMTRLNNPENTGAFEKALQSLAGRQSNSNGPEAGGPWKKATEDLASWIVNRTDWPKKLADRTSAFFQDLRYTIPELGASLNNGLARLPVGRPASPAGSVDTETIIVGIFALAIALAGWKLLGMRKVAIERRQVHGMAIEEQPVAPSSIDNRDDLVQAFEYLALLRLGVAGRTCNHLAVAAKLNEDELDDSRRAAAGELARLYERARYVPDPAPFGEADLAAARRDFSLLGGVAAA
jgi:hypothetical protein